MSDECICVIPVYVRALRACRPNHITICEDSFSARNPLRLAEPSPGTPADTAVRVWHFAEKQTDVSLAADLISDAWRGQMEQTVICSNDSDLAGALAGMRRNHPKLRIGGAAPVGDVGRVSAHLAQHALA